MGTAVKIRDQYDALAGPEKAAILLLALGEDRSAGIMEKLDDAELRMVSRAIAGVGTITAGVLEELIRNFTRRFANGGSVIGSLDAAERMLKSFLPPEKVSDVINYIRGPGGRSTWEKMSAINEALLAKYLTGEHPQTVAVVLSKIAPDHAAKVMALLPGGLLADVGRRMVRLKTVPGELLADIEEMLQRDLMLNYAAGDAEDSHARMAEILNRADNDTVSRLMGDLETDDPDHAIRIKELMFTFTDLLALDDLSLSTVVRASDTDTLAYALKGSDDDARERIYGALSERAGAILRDSVETMGPVLSRDVEAAKTAMVNKARELADADVIILHAGEGDAAIVY